MKLPSSNQSVMLALVLLTLLFTSHVNAANQLKGHSSPYLAMHGDDPVHWHEWGEAAISKARSQGKMLFVSVGYFSCHWCHVMQRESYQSQEIARILNKHFVSIKIDRELRPELDSRLIEFVQATTGRAGWPLNVFLSPEGYAITGLVYAPQPRFKRILLDMQENWQQRREELTTAAQEVDQLIAVSREAENSLTSTAVASHQSAFLDSFSSQVDLLQGGFGAQAKFPVAPQMQAALDLYAVTPQEEVKKGLLVTLDKMARLGLQDHVGGGFFRYTVDPGWETPHYEKMLYTNAMLATLYLRAGQTFGRADYTTVGRRTLDFMLAELSAGDGAFIASLSAVDAQGNEGAYYLWSQKELEKQFDQESLNLVNVSWNMMRNIDDSVGILPHEDFDREHIKKVFGLTEAQLQAKLMQLKQKLVAYRTSHRSLPRDTKRLAGWNGLALTAFAEAAQLDPRYRQAGDRLVSFMSNRFWKNGRFYHAVDDKQRSFGTAGLFDYGAIAQGLVAWHKATGDARAQKMAKQIVDAAWQRFYTDKGWQTTEKTLLPNPVYQRHLRDTALPSAEGLLVKATQGLLQQSGTTGLKQKLESLLARSTDSMHDESFYFGTLISAAK